MMMDSDTDISISSLTLPHIPELKRVIPNDMIRSSLFTVSNHNRKREYLKNASLCSFRNTEMTYTGEELRQDDEDVWLQLIYLASANALSRVDFKPYGFLREIGWPQTVQYRNKLKGSLARMSATDLSIHNKEFQKGIDLSLVRKFIWSSHGEKLEKWQVWLEPEIVKLFTELGRAYSKIHWEQRKKLNPLAKWLHAFYSSHAEPLPIFLGRVMQLSGSKTKNMKHFKPMIRESLLELCQVGFLSSYFIDSKNYLEVVRTKEKYKQMSYG